MNRLDNRPARSHLYRTSRFRVMDPPEGGARWWPRGLVKALLALLALWAVLAFDYPVGLPSGAEFDQSNNGAWIGARWSSTLVPQEQVSDLVQSFEGRGIDRVFANVGTLLSDGRLPHEDFLYAGGLVEYIHRAPGRLKAIAWISGHFDSHGLVLSDPAVRSRIVDSCKYLVQELDFDGIQFDIEPMPSGNTDFLQLLTDLRAAIGSKRISVAGMKWTPIAPQIGSTNVLPYSWDSAYYREVARHADEIVVMTYDSGIPLSNLYIKYVAWQTSQILDTLRDVPACQVLIGVPTYDDDTFWHHRSENIGSGLQGVIEALGDFRQAGDLPINFAGIALYSEESTSPEEWATYEKVWHANKEPAP